MPKLQVYIFAIMIALFLPPVAKAQTIRDPWEASRQKATHKIVHTDKMDILIITPANLEEIQKSNQTPPVLVLLKGLYPSVSYEAYNHVIWGTAKMGAIVIVPIYKPDTYYGWKEDFDKSREITNYGFETKTVANDIVEAITPELDKYQGSDVYVYAHSLGSMIALWIGKSQSIEHRIKGMLVDGIPHDGELEAKNEKVDHYPKDLSFIFPVTYLYYEGDKVFGPASKTAFEETEAPFKQLIVIKGYGANHFSSMTYDPRSKNETNLFGFMVDESAKTIYGYKPEIKSSVVEEYGLNTLVPALVFSNSKLPQFREAREYIYGTKREYKITLNGKDKSLRHVIAESSKN